MLYLDTEKTNTHTSFVVAGHRNHIIFALIVARFFEKYNIVSASVSLYFPLVVKRM